LNLYLAGMANYNSTEHNNFSTSLQAKAILDRKYFTIGDLFKNREVYHSLEECNKPDLYIGMSVPEGLNCDTITSKNLASLVK
jgi:hypothetical protein